MQSSANRKRSHLPKRFPVGTTYVVEGHGGENGQLRVYSRYVVLPGGERINLAADLAGAVSQYRRSRGQRRPAKRCAQTTGKQRSARTKKIIVVAGTTRLRRR